MRNASAGVTASTQAAADAGAGLLAAGGNAIDAAVATALASCVADPCNTGLGGYGGHMLIARLGSTPICVDFNASLPVDQAERLHQTRAHAWGPSLSVVPNVVSGLAAALVAFGSKSWSEVSTPAINLAREGVHANVTTRQAFQEVTGASFVEECFCFEPRQAADNDRQFRFFQPALANTLEKMVAKGPDWFYQSDLSIHACKSFHSAGFSVTNKQWEDTWSHPSISPASCLELAHGSLYSAPLGTSGSASMFATVVAGIDVAAKGRLDSPGMMVRWARAIASSWGFRFGTPAGNDFANLNISDWIGKALPFDDPVAIGEGVGHTCHLNACDYSGTLVSMTLTHGPLWFGGRWAIPASGVIMNAGIPVLAAAPPINSGGRLYAVTNMAPTVAHLRNGSAVAIGCPGARRIPTIIGIALVRHMLGGLTLQDAISAGRFHAEVLSRATVEKKRMSPTVLEAFSSGFLDVEDEGESLYYGPLTAICRGPSGELTFGLDDRLFKGASRELPCELG